MKNSQADKKATHTPGPWKIERVPIQSRGGSNTCFKIGPFQACIYDDWGARERGVTEQENEANARLIAAAPELLNALKLAMKHINGYINIGSDDWQTMESAIKKATQ